jgi:hypothetical protein
MASRFWERSQTAGTVTRLTRNRKVDVINQLFTYMFDIGLYSRMN